MATQEQATETLRGIAAGIAERDPDAAAQRLLEKISTRADAPVLRDALVEQGARAIVAS